MNAPASNCDLRQIPASGPYIRVLLRGRPVHTDDDFSLRHPRMERSLRAKIFAPFDALEGFSDRIRTRDTALVSSMEQNSRCRSSGSTEDVLDEPDILVYDEINKDR